LDGRELFDHAPLNHLILAGRNLEKSRRPEFEAAQFVSVHATRVEPDLPGQMPDDFSVRRMAEDDGVGQDVLVTNELFSNPEKMPFLLFRERNPRQDPCVYKQEIILYVEKPELP
jgi:hypothetical protein